MLAPVTLGLYDGSELVAYSLTLAASGRVGVSVGARIRLRPSR